jgi:hypothetical protein
MVKLEKAKRGSLEVDAGALQTICMMHCGMKMAGMDWEISNFFFPLGDKMGG